MSLSPTKRRAEHFADLLESADRTDDPTLAPLVALSSALQTAAPAAQPAPEFRTALRQRLVAVATVQGVGETASVSSRVRESASAWRMQRRLALVAGSAAAITAVAGVGIGASRSLPGDAFYGLKRADENVQLAIARGDEAKGKKHLEFARARLSEVKALAARGEALPTFVPGRPLAAAAPQSGNDLISDTLRAMDEQTRAGATDLFLAYQHSGSTEPLTTLNDFTVQQYAELMALLPALPGDVQPPAKRSLALLRIVSTDTATLAPKHKTTSGTDGTGTHPTSRPTTKRSTGASSTPKPTPSTVTSSPDGSTGAKQTPAPTDVPTIPPVPTVVPLPTDLPTTLPPLPDIGSLGSLLQGG